MTDEKIRQVINQYKEVFDKLGLPAKQLSNYKDYSCRIYDIIGHARWMLY